MSAGTLYLDFETASAVDLRKTGVAPYVRHASTRVLCFCYAFDDGPVQAWTAGEPLPPAVLDHVSRARAVSGWNVGFEIEVWNQVLTRQAGLHPIYQSLSAQQCYDTMAQAAYWGLPLSLDTASQAAATGHPKDKEGHALMLRMSRPRETRPDGTMTWWHEDEPDRLFALVRYCKRDVEAERAIARKLHPLPERERRIWLLDHQINQNGVAFDLRAIDGLLDRAEEAKDALSGKLRALTGGEVASVNATGRLQLYLRDRGYPHTDLKKPTVEARLADPDCTGNERAALELRRDGARTSASKLVAMKNAALPMPGHPGVGIIRGMLQHYGANRTGRWAGRLVQPQNLPRPELSPEAVSAFLAAMHDTPLAVLETLFGSTMAAIASSLRGCIIARPGCRLVVADFSQIEARVIAWLGGEQAVLDAFRRADTDPNAPDIYEIAAAGIFGIRPEDVTKDQRQIGKVATLALGYAGGVGAFQTMAAAYGLVIPDAQADQIKVAWRGANQNIVGFWHELNSAAMVTVQTGRTTTVGCLTFGMLKTHLLVRLPSGRHLAYRDVSIEPGDFGPQVTYYGVDQYTRKWGVIRTYGGKFAENITQAVARDAMADAMLEADRRGHFLTLTVHDELLSEAEADRADARLADLLSIMSVPPAWATDLPVKGDGFVADRYRK